MTSSTWTRRLKALLAAPVAVVMLGVATAPAHAVTNSATPAART